MFDFIAVVALAGGFLGIAILAGAPIGSAAPTGDGTLQTRLRGNLPYGPAIAVGGLWLVALLAPT
jgi:prepilin peptidase CpaA